MSAARYRITAREAERVTYQVERITPDHPAWRGHTSWVGGAPRVEAWLVSRWLPVAAIWGEPEQLRQRFWSEPEAWAAVRAGARADRAAGTRLGIEVEIVGEPVGLPTREEREAAEDYAHLVERIGT